MEKEKSEQLLNQILKRESKLLDEVIVLFKELKEPMDNRRTKEILALSKRIERLSLLILLPVLENMMECE